MKIACNVTGGTNRSDQWVTCRCEGRSAINVGFGLALLGHEVDIVCPTFDHGISPMPGVTLKQQWDVNKKYDLVYIWGVSNATFPFDNYKKAIYMLEPSAPPENLRNITTIFPKAELFTASRKAVPLVKELAGLDIRYFPILYPIPCCPGTKKNDFFDFNFDPTKKNINVWAFIDGWPNYHITCDTKILEILRILRDKYGYNINLTVHQGGRNAYIPEVSTIISEFNASIINNKDVCYLDMLCILSSMDICITKGGWCYAGNCAFDIVSLGKFMIYVTEGKSETYNINDIYPLEEWVIRQEDDSSIVNQKLDHIISDPLTCYTAMKNELITYSFPVWSKMVTEIIDGLNLT